MKKSLFQEKFKNLLMLLAVAGMTLVSCGGKQQSGDVTDGDSIQVPVFDADSAFQSIVKQCSFGPRVMNSEAHDRCGDYIVAAFKACGLSVTEQEATIPSYDGTPLKMRNIIARCDTANPARILLCAHWDSRPWADNDPDEANHKKPVMAANDGASGVAVLLEIARVIKDAKPAVGIDFVCFDAEDGGVPSWDNVEDEQAEMNSWSLGSQYFSANLIPPSYSPRYGVLLDMVGARGARFYKEGFSMQYAPSVVDKMWSAASRAGYSSYFIQEDGGYVTDDHGPLNQIARIPTIDIIPYFKNMSGSSFGPTWHTVSDTPENIDKGTLKAVGQSVLQLLFEEKD